MADYGLLGRRLSHSISPQIHTLLCGYDYELIEKEPEELDGFFESKNFKGINVTIPYKKDVIKYCAELSATAKKIGSVNTIVKRADGSLFGDNTDYFGFKFMFEESGAEIKNKTALVLGTGGASLTVKAVLEDMGAANIVSVSRSGKINYKNVYDFSSADVIINTTPVGMYPNNGERLLEIDKFGNLSGVFDLIYNPSLTPLLYDAQQLGVPYCSGLKMLVAQAWLAAEKFTGKKLDESETERVIGVLEKERRNIVLIGMPGSGKSTVSALLGKKLLKEVIDTDSLIEQKDGRTIPEIFARSGEDFFRNIESEVVAEAGKKKRNNYFNGRRRRVKRRKPLRLKAERRCYLAQAKH
ncbi:MAG: shikimate kinase [Clostridia bacterium]|nr:shikimate kinase [Clostridia bacterium]